MRVTIIPFDKIVAVDGYGIGDIDFSGFDPDIHAVQFLDGEGYIEYKNRAPEKITNLYRFDHLINQHREKKDFIEKRKIDPYHGMTLEDRMSNMKEDKRWEVKKYFWKQETATVTTPYGTFNGGEGSASSILGAIDLADALGETQVILTNIDDEPVTLNKNQAMQVAVLVGKAFRDQFFKKQQTKVAIKNAPTPSDITAIVEDIKKT